MAEGDAGGGGETCGDDVAEAAGLTPVVGCGVGATLDVPDEPPHPASAIPAVTAAHMDARMCVERDRDPGGTGHRDARWGSPITTRQPAHALVIYS